MSTSGFEHLRLELDRSGILTVWMARAPANAVDQVMYRELAKLFSDIDQAGEGVRVVILAGEGKHFCAGNDLDEFATMTPENGTERMWRVREAFFAISDCAVPVIGAVQGAALGTGLALAGSCDFVVAERTARFGLPELTVGVMGGAQHLARIAPGPLVRRMYFTGQPVTAEELHAFGGCVFLCEPGERMAEARRMAERVAGYSPTAVRVSKRILDRIETMDLKNGYTFEQAGTVRMSGHPDSKEALDAFREKREPRYRPEVDLTMFD
jgi:enoyl-CoA hydratase/carnithine racemase